MYELVLLSPEPLVEPLSDALIDELGALSVAVEDADAGCAGEAALFGEPGMPAPASGWQRSRLQALFETAADAEHAARALQSDHASAGLRVHAIAAVADQDWVRLTQAQFAPVAITPEFWIVPSWHEPPPGARAVIRLDPGLAFGTGTHPTTRMCLRWLAARPGSVRGARALDYGCGSGILAIAAALFGAASVTAVDIDPAALQATRENAARNGAAAVATGTPDTAAGGYDVVLANILSTPLRLLAPLLSSQVAPGGWLVLAGILERQADELTAAYAPALALTVADFEDGWSLMCAQRARA